jgi:hypothetical protein
MAYPPFHPSSNAPVPLFMSRGEFGEAFPAENDYVERKSGVGRAAVQDAVVAFSNADGGVVLIGVDDAGTILGRELSPSALDDIHQAIRGANGGEDLGLDRLTAAGVTVTGRLTGFDGSRAVFADDLAANVAAADTRLRKLLRRIDAHSLAEGCEPEPLPDVIFPPTTRTLDLRRVGAIVWATGFRRGYPWLHVPGVLDQRGEIVQHRGATRACGLYTLGLAYQSRRNSHFIGGVARDAETVARSILERRAARAPARTPAVAA